LGMCLDPGSNPGGSTFDNNLDLRQGFFQSLCRLVQIFITAHS
jgi:hypothetical protein